MASGTRSKTRYALLGLLTLGDLSGYDIKQIAERSLAFFWSESYGQIYPTLKVLAQEGLVTSTRQEQGGRVRVVYAITEAGRAALREWLVAPAEAEVRRNELLLKLFFGPEVPVDEAIAHVERHQASMQHQAQVYAAVREQLQSPPESASPKQPYWLITLRAGEHFVQAQLAWGEETLATLRRLQAEGYHPGTPDPNAECKEEP